MDRGKIFVHIRPRWSGKTTRIAKHFLDRSKRGFILCRDQQGIQNLFSTIMDEVNKSVDDTLALMYNRTDMEKLKEYQSEINNHITDVFKKSVAIYEIHDPHSYSNYVHYHNRIYIDDMYGMSQQHQDFLKSFVSRGGNLHIYTTLYEHNYKDLVITRYINRHHEYRTLKQFYNIASRYTERYLSIDGKLPNYLLTDPRTVFKEFYVPSHNSIQFINIKNKFSI